jgi:cytochrome c oxidase cbb3-type subunit 3
MMILLIAVAFLAPLKLSASSILVNSTGLSDETLLMILLVASVLQVIAIVVIANVIKSLASNRDLWQIKGRTKAGIITLLLGLTSVQAMAKSADFDALITMDDTGFLILVTLNLVLLFTFLYLVSKLNGITRMMMDEDGSVPETFMDKMRTMLTDAVPIDKEADVEMDHEYDGIRELDNNLPPWWLYGFYFCIAFAFVYIIYYHFTDSGQLQLEEYQVEMQEAEDAKQAFVATQENVVDENNVELLTDASALTSGAKIFKLYCAPCHAEHGGSSPGGVGPNLTDDHWINGGSTTDIFKTIKYGVPEKGMVSWQAQLNPTQIQEVTSFIMSIVGTNPDNAKEAQGELYESVIEPAESESQEQPEEANDEVEAATVEE